MKVINWPDAVSQRLVELTREWVEGVSLGS